MVRRPRLKIKSMMPAGAWEAVYDGGNAPLHAKPLICWALVEYDQEEDRAEEIVGMITDFEGLVLPADEEQVVIAGKEFDFSHYIHAEP